MSSSWGLRTRARRPAVSAYPVLRVGLRVLVTGGEPRSRDVPLADAAGNVIASVADGDEVEILAWRRGRDVDPRYCVRSHAGVEGWIEAANLARKGSLPDPPEAVDVPPGHGFRR